MKHLLLISASVLALGSQAQVDTVLAPAAFNRVLFGISASADHCFRSLGSIPTSSATGTAFWSGVDQPKFGCTVGLKLQYNFTRHWALGIGAQYANRGYTSKGTFNWIMAEPFDPVIPKGIKTRYDHHYIDIPIRLIFQAGQKRLRFTSSLGLAGNVLLHVSALQKVEYEDGHVEDMHRKLGAHYRNVNLSAIASVGAAYQLSDRSSLQLEPSFLYNLYPISDSGSKPTLWSTGLDLTFFYALR